MRRLLSVLHHPVYGGPHNEALRLAPARAALGWETLVLLPDDGNAAAARLRESGVTVRQLPLHRLRASRDPGLQLRFPLGFAADIRRIRRLIREERVDLVVVGGLVNPQAALAARLEHVPVVWQILDSRTPWLLRRVFMPVVGRLADAVLFAGRGLIDLHAGSRSLAVPCFVYYPPVQTTRFQPTSDPRAALRSLGIPEGASVVGMVANLNPQKGIEFFIRTASYVYRARPDTWFLVIGARHGTHDGYWKRLEAEMQQAGVPRDRFIFAGERTDVERYYPAMAVKLITSVPRSEGTPTTAIEAMACGVPVVTTDVGAVAEVVQHTVTGFVVPPLDANALAQATLRLLNDPDRRERMGAAGRCRAVARYDVAVCAADQVRAFDAAIQHHARRSGHAIPSRPGPVERL